MGSKMIKKVKQEILWRTLFSYRHLTVKSDRRLSSWAGILREDRGDWCSLYTRNRYPPTFTLLFQDVHTRDSLIRIAAPTVLRVNYFTARYVSLHICTSVLNLYWIFFAKYIKVLVLKVPLKLYYKLYEKM